MGFWSGFEGLTGHQPGAFKGFSLKDILDDDLWKRRERLGGRQSRQFEETGVVPTTAWYKGMGRPEMMGPEVGAAGTEVKENLLSTNPDMYAGVNQRRFDATTLANQQRRNALWGSGPATVSAARPWANIQSQMLGDPRRGVGRDRPFPVARRPDIASQAEQDRLRAINSGNPAALRAAGITPAMGGINREPKWIDKTTTVKSSAADGVPDTTTTVYKEKVQPTSIMNMNQPGFLEKLGSGIGEQWSNLWDGSVLRHGAGAWDAMKDLARKRHEEEMLRRQRGY